MAVKVRIIDDKKFLWDGMEYESEDKAKSVEKEYLENGFEVRLVKEGKQVFIYTRRVVTEVVVVDQP